MSGQGLLEVLENGSLLQLESLRDREDAFNKSAAGCTVTAKGNFRHNTPERIMRSA